LTKRANISPKNLLFFQLFTSIYYLNPNTFASKKQKNKKARKQKNKKARKQIFLIQLIFIFPGFSS